MKRVRPPVIPQSQARVQAQVVPYPIHVRRTWRVTIGQVRGMIDACQGAGCLSVSN
jgi:hypothetical protein